MTDDVEQRVLEFWFGKEHSPEYGVRQAKWFEADAEFDARVAETFGADYEAAIGGEYDWLTDSAKGSLALVILLDQFPRNMFRGTARAFEADGKARSIARIAIEDGFDQLLSPVLRSFFYLPFEHSEYLADQELSVLLFESLNDAELLRYAVSHHDVVARFGRFPHRNEQLGRESTAEETAFLQESGSSFGNQMPRKK